MKDCFAPAMTPEEVGALSSLALAHVGDGVFELLVRTKLCREGGLTAANLHRAAVGYVSAPAQARAVERLLPLLTEEERDVLRRGRNAKSHLPPKGASLGEYHAATALEALFGFLYLTGRRERVGELFAAALGDEHGA